MTQSTADPADLTDENNWCGGFYELALELGDRDDGRVDAALAALWRVAGIEGCYLGGLERGKKQPAPCTAAGARESGSLSGVMRLSDGRPVVCGAAVIRFDDGGDWLQLFIPLGALAELDPRIGGFPFGPRAGIESLEWRHPLDEWLAGLAREIHRAVPFHIALVGFEVSCERPASIPEVRHEGYLEGDTLRYWPATR